MSEINITLNDVFKTTVIGDKSSPIGSSLFGINHRKTPFAVPTNKDDHGYVFFTRPQLNLTDTNLRAERRFVPLLDQNDLSLPRYIRRTLDPRLSPRSYPCPVVDPRQAFIPLMTNMLLSCSGWPEPTLDTFTSRAGVRQEVFSYVDSAIENYKAYDLQLSFRNMPGDPLTTLVDHWMWYQSRVFSGEMVPYPDFIAQNVVDYQTRVWRLVMDKNRQYVQKIACCGVGMFVGNPTSNSFNYESDRPLNQLNDTLSFRLSCTGFMYQDPILIHEFNQTVGIFNPDLKSLSDLDVDMDNPPLMKDRQALEHTVLQSGEHQFFSDVGYPLIDPDTHELLWYVPTTIYQARSLRIERISQAIGWSL